MDRDSKIYVAGHAGLVGSALAGELRRRGFNNILIRSAREVDLRLQQETLNLFEEQKPEYVFLAAAKVGGIKANETYRAEFIYDNLMIAANVIYAAFRNGVKKLLNLGSSCIYPRDCPQPMREEMLLGGRLEPTNEPYAVAKIAAIKLCRYFNNQYGTDYMSVMPCNLYGPGDNFDLKSSHVLPAMIRKFRLAELLRNGKYREIKRDFLVYGNTDLRQEGCAMEIDEYSSAGDLEAALGSLGISRSEVILWGTGEPLREFLYSGDLASACVHLMQNSIARDLGEAINVGAGHDLSIGDLAVLVSRAAGYGGQIKWDSSMPDGTPRKLLDISRIGSLGWKARTPLEEGLKKVYEWYSANSE